MPHCPLLLSLFLVLIRPCPSSSLVVVPCSPHPSSRVLIFFIVIVEITPPLSLPVMHLTTRLGVPTKDEVAIDVVLLVVIFLVITANFVVVVNVILNNIVIIILVGIAPPPRPENPTPFGFPLPTAAQRYAPPQPSTLLSLLSSLSSFLLLLSLLSLSLLLELPPPSSLSARNASNHDVGCYIKTRLSLS